MGRKLFAYGACLSLFVLCQAKEQCASHWVVRQPHITSVEALPLHATMRSFPYATPRIKCLYMLAALSEQLCVCSQS